MGLKENTYITEMVTQKRTHPITEMVTQKEHIMIR